MTRPALFNSKSSHISAYCCKALLCAWQRYDCKGVCTCSNQWHVQTVQNALILWRRWEKLTAAVLSVGSVCSVCSECWEYHLLFLLLSLWLWHFAFVLFADAFTLQRACMCNCQCLLFLCLKMRVQHQAEVRNIVSWPTDKTIRSPPPPPYSPACSHDTCN
jgi:hypothetical protein